MIQDRRIDAGKGFDWGRTSEDYAKYRDIYPEECYQKIIQHGLCTKGQRVLDLGTGTGVLPRNLYRYGASFVGSDLSEEQIEQARRLAAENGQEISFVVSSAETAPFPENSFDVITACQCFFYFNHAVALPRIAAMLRPGGKLAILYMAWLPEEDPVAGASEELVLRYNPVWTGAGETRRPIAIPEEAEGLFAVEESELFDLQVPFTRESWAGRIRACRGIGASLRPEEIAAFEREHQALLREIAPESFSVRHYAAMAVLRVLK